MEASTPKPTTQTSVTTKSRTGDRQMKSNVFFMSRLNSLDKRPGRLLSRTFTLEKNSRGVTTPAIRFLPTREA